MKPLVEVDDVELDHLAHRTRGADLPAVGLASGVVVATWLVVGLLKNRSLLDAAKPAKPAAYMPPHRRRPASPGPRKSPRRAKSPAPTRA